MPSVSLTSCTSCVKIRPNGAGDSGCPGATYPFPSGFGVAPHRAQSAIAKRCGLANLVAGIGRSVRTVILVLTVALALIAGWTDWRSRRIPNWLTVPGFLVGLGANMLASGMVGLKTSLVGAGLGLLVLLPFVFLRSLGAGDWKLAGALGSLVGWAALADLLMGSVLVAGVMALGLVIYKRRFKETLRNIAGILASMFTLHMPRAEVSLDNPQSLKVPYGVALALTTLIFGAAKIWGAR